MSASEEFGDICKAWWAGVTAGHSGRDRADLAQLRRATAPVEVLTHPATHRLHRALSAAGHDLQSRPETLALIVMVLAQVKTSGRRLALRLGRGREPVYSPLRFDRLIRTQDPMDLAQQLRRALAQVRHEADVAALARDLRHWTDRTRATWCFDYYGAGDAAP